MRHADIVRQLYAAFQRGDIPAILNRLADDVTWEYSLTPLGVPWLEPRRGRGEVPQFFAAQARFDLHRFEPKTFLESGNIVVVLIDVDLTVTSTGRRITEEDEVHIWHFDSQGQVIKFGHKVDTHQHWIACGNDGATG